MHDFKKFNVWKKARVFTKDIYSISKSFPDDEKFGLTSQLRRATISITNNIAEGCGRDTNKQLVQFLNYSYGSAIEVENVLILAADLEFIGVADFQKLNDQLIQIQKMLFTLIHKFKE